MHAGSQNRGSPDLERGWVAALAGCRYQTLAPGSGAADDTCEDTQWVGQRSYLVAHLRACVEDTRRVGGYRDILGEFRTDSLGVIRSNVTVEKIPAALDFLSLGNTYRR